MQNTATGIRIGNYDPAGNQSFFHYLFFTREGLVIVLLVSLACFVYLQLASFFLSPVLESLRIRAEKRLTTGTMRCYGGRWLGIWSPNDEAINGLKATLNLSLTFVATMTAKACLSLGLAGVAVTAILLGAVTDLQLAHQTGRQQSRAATGRQIGSR